MEDHLLRRGTNYDGHKRSGGLVMMAPLIPGDHLCIGDHLTRDKNDSFNCEYSSYRNGPNYSATLI